MRFSWVCDVSRDVIVCKDAHQELQPCPKAVQAAFTWHMQLHRAKRRVQAGRPALSAQRHPVTCLVCACARSRLEEALLALILLCNVGSEVRQTCLLTLLCSLQAVWPWGSHSTSLSLNSSVCKVELTTTAPTTEGGLQVRAYHTGTEGELPTNTRCFPTLPLLSLKPVPRVHARSPFPRGGPAPSPAAFCL